MAIQYSTRRLLMVTIWLAFSIVFWAKTQIAGGFEWSPAPIRYGLPFSVAATIGTACGRMWTGIAIGFALALVIGPMRVVE
jgi:hypothetical protein